MTAPVDLFSLTKDQKIHLACSMVPCRAAYEGPGVPLEKRIRDFYRDMECPVRGHRLNPVGDCVFCGLHLEVHENPPYRDLITVATPCGPMMI
jgi:hypothetical protein